MIAADESDSPPASAVAEAFGGLCQETKAALGRWRDVVSENVQQLNATLRP